MKKAALSLGRWAVFLAKSWASSDPILTMWIGWRVLLALKVQRGRWDQSDLKASRDRQVQRVIQVLREYRASKVRKESRATQARKGHRGSRE
jgi:hypothetical protein